MIDDRQKDHAMEKCVGLATCRIVCAAKSDFANNNRPNNNNFYTVSSSYQKSKTQRRCEESFYMNIRL